MSQGKRGRWKGHTYNCRVRVGTNGGEGKRETGREVPADSTPSPLFTFTYRMV